MKKNKKSFNNKILFFEKLSEQPLSTQKKILQICPTKIHNDIQKFCNIVVKSKKISSKKVCKEIKKVHPLSKKNF